MCEIEIINYLLNKEHIKIIIETCDSYRQNGHGYW